MRVGRGKDGGGKIEGLGVAYLLLEGESDAGAP